MLVHQGPPPQGRKAAPVRERLVDNRGQHDARHDINEHRRRRHGDMEERGYSVHRGGCYDSDEDRMMPEPLGPRVFSRTIRSTPLLACSDPRPASPNTMVKPSQNCGWQISGWHASWEVLEGTIELSSTNCLSSSPTLLVGGSRSSLPTRSMTRLIWSGCLKETSRERIYTLETRGT